MTKKDFKSCWESGDITSVAFAVFISQRGEVDYKEFVEMYFSHIRYWDREERGFIWTEGGILVGLAPHKPKGKHKTQWHDVITAEWLGDFKQIQTNE